MAMFHKFIHNDNGIDCYRCGVSLDFPWLNSDSDVWDSGVTDVPDVIGIAEQEQMEDELRFFLPNCPGATGNRGHHFYGLGNTDKEDSDHLIGAIECYYGDAYIGWETNLLTVQKFCEGY
jgi:hypothetical protein